MNSYQNFNPQSGSRIERLFFNHRKLVLIIFAVITAILVSNLGSIQLNASFEKMIPTTHPFIANYMSNKEELSGLGNAVRVAVENPNGDIYDPQYLDVLRQISDELFLLPGVDRSGLKSLWTPNVRWVGVTEEGLEGGPVIPNEYLGRPEDIKSLRNNVARSGEIGKIVALDERSSIVFMPLLADDNKNGARLNYSNLAQDLEIIREKYLAKGVIVHITGFAKVVGELISGLRSTLGFFALAIALATFALYIYTRCLRSTILVVACSLVAVIWQLGLLPILNKELDPYSILVPFLVFAIGMSHGAQKMNGIMQDIGRGAHKLVAARFTFRRLFLAGFTALVCDAVGFAVLYIIQIDAIQDLAVIASIGVAALVFTNLILLPILLSYVGVSADASERSVSVDQYNERSGLSSIIWIFLAKFTQRKYALRAILFAGIIGVLGLFVSSKLKIGDLDPGAPELRSESLYNKDTSYISSHYGANSDVFAVIVKTEPGHCADYDVLMRIDALEWALSALPGVATTESLAKLNRRVLVGLNEGNPKWYELINGQRMLNTITANAPRALYNDSCSIVPIFVYLKDHKADTLNQVVELCQAFSTENGSSSTQFLLAAGSAGIEAATNIVVKKANSQMLILVYVAVIVLCLITFRSWRAVLCAVVPLVLTSVLCEALMVVLGIGVKVATLPVIALGVGIGVDYALYIMSIVLAGIRSGSTLEQAYERALKFTGRVVLLTGVTLAVGVFTWVLSPIKFQADMGLLLGFMFIGNMAGALILLPSLAFFVLKHNNFKHQWSPK